MSGTRKNSLNQTLINNMYRRFSFLRITEKIVKNIQPHRISLLKTANETNFSNELQSNN